MCVCVICITLSKIVGMIRASNKGIGIIISGKELRGYKQTNCSASRWLVTTVLIELWYSNCVEHQQQQNHNSSHT
jgi:hypothetical protein